MKAKMIKGMSFAEVIADVQKKAEEFAKLPPEEQARLNKEQEEALQEYFKGGGASLIGIAVPPKGAK